MPLHQFAEVEIPPRLIESIQTFPLRREVKHCGSTFEVSPFDLYADCPHCRSRVKVRAFSASAEIEDVFDAVFEWMSQPGAPELVQRRQEALAADRDEG